MSDMSNLYRIALATPRFPTSPADSVEIALHMTAEAASLGAQIVCFPECFIPGYRRPGVNIPPPDQSFLNSAWQQIAELAGQRKIAVVLGTERVVDNQLRASALIIDRNGQFAGFQDKVQVDPSEDNLYTPGIGRRIFSAGPMRFGVVICHEGWRYPETVRAAARQGARLVFHPHYAWPEEDSFRPETFADPRNSFHEKAMLCRAAENTCYFASVNYAEPGSPTTSAVAAADGSLICYQPYGQEGILIAEIDLLAATGDLAHRFKPHANVNSD